MTHKHSATLIDRGLPGRGGHLGFTLIELMVGIAIVSLLMMFVIPGMGSWMQSTRIRNAAESIENGLQLARAEAVSRNTSVQLVFSSLVASGTAVDWSVSCVTGTSTCPGVGSVSPTLTYIQKASSKEGASTAQIATLPTGQSTIVFNGLGRVSSMPAGTTTISLVITNSYGGTCAQSGGPMRCLNIAVTSSGQIRMCDPALTTGSSPRAC
jgi:type IV fimbrial biogenesis protein FimT